MTYDDDNIAATGGCFLLVAAAAVVSLWILIAKEDNHCDYNVDNGTSAAVGLLLQNQDDHIIIQGSWLLLSFRVLAFASLIALLSWDLFKYDFLIFVYYSEWSILLVILYFALGIVTSAHACWMKHKKNLLPSGGLDINYNPEHDPVLLEKITTLRLLKLIMQIIYQASAGATVLTDFVFWCVIVPFLSMDNFSLNLLTGSIHSVNLLLLLIDTTFNCLPFPFFRIAYFVLWSCAYVVFQWVLHACGFPWWPYSFLDLSLKWAPICYLCIGLIHVPCYGFYYIIVKAKDFLSSRSQSNCSKF